MQRFADLFATVRDRVSRAVEDGDARRGVDPDRLIELVGGATMLRLLLRPTDDLDENWVAQTAALVVNGVVA
jgi:hypothetical protein